MNPIGALLHEVIPPKARKYVYAVIALVALVWSLYEASGGDWKLFVGGLVGTLAAATAASNTPSTPQVEYEPRHDA